MPSKKQEKSGTDAITLLKQDHEKVRQMFEEFEKADEDRKFELAAEICQALTVHSTIEEEIFYPQVRESIEAEDLMLEAEIEHDTVKNLIERVQEGEVDETQLSAMIKVMNEYVNHHVNEEQRRMFPRVKRVGARPGGARQGVARAQDRARSRAAGFDRSRVRLDGSRRRR